ncbi:MAG TPA: sugar transferase [Candidatus Saccharimonadales bacterium]|nr:sugar transferase [Candidatus Saccharimonadales bacterium]
MSLYDFEKRLIDIAAALFGILLFSPIMIFFSLFIKLVSSEGPILADIPERVGKNGKNFRMYKFRSMIPNAYQWLLDHPEIYTKYKENNYKLDADSDPRLIKGAKFLRNSSIDELPQFFNVLRGQMSMVGPRAYYPFEIDEQTKKFNISQDLVDEVLSVKPGVTGVWQVSGRSSINFVDRIKMDANYAKKRSILYDLYIILKTPYAVISRKGVV